MDLLPRTKGRSIERWSESAKPLASWLVWSLAFLLACLPCAAHLPGSHPWWSVAVLLAMGGVHAGALAALLVLLFEGTSLKAPRAARAATAAMGTIAVVYVGVDSLLYGLHGMHIGRNNFGYLFEPDALTTLGISRFDLGLLAGVGALVFVAGYWAFGKKLGPIRALRLGAALISLDGVALVGFAVLRFWGFQPLIGLAEAMPLAPKIRIERALSKAFHAAPQAIDDDFQFPPPIFLEASRRTLRPMPWPTRSERKPDVWILSVESLRADAIEAMPNLTELAKSSLVASRHYSGGNCSFLGLFSLLSGLDPSFWGFEQTWRAGRGLSALQALGYEVTLLASPALNFGVPWRVLEDGRRAVTTWRGGTPIEHDEAAVEWAIDQIEHPHRRPSARVLFFDASHWPYWVQGSHWTSGSFGDSWAHRYQVAELKARYLRSVAEIDSRLGRILAALKRTGRDQDSVVVVTGDHGEAFREHGVFGHGSRLDEEQVRVPLVLHFPGIPPAQIPGPTVHQDVLPTVLGYLGASPASGPEGGGVDLLHHQARAAPPTVGSCGIGWPEGFEALLDFKRLFFQLDGTGAHFVALLDGGGMAIEEASDEPAVREALRSEEGAFFARLSR